MATATPIWESEAPSEIVRKLLGIMGGNVDPVALMVGDIRWASEVQEWAGGEPLPRGWMVESLREAYRAVILLRAKGWAFGPPIIKEWFLTLNATIGFEAPLQVLSRDLPRFQDYLERMCIHSGFSFCPECREQTLAPAENNPGHNWECFACGYSGPF